MLELREAPRLTELELDDEWPPEWSDGVDESKAPEVVARAAPTGRDELSAFGLLGPGAGNPPMLRSLSALPAREALGAMGLLGAGTGGPRTRRSLDACSPAELLGALSLSGG